jgi:hypothetical protein
MNASFSLPSDLSYLQCALDRLAGLDVEELDEDFDATFLFEAVWRRFEGYELEAAKETFSHDMGLFGHVCDAHGKDYPQLTFLKGLLYIVLGNPELLLGPLEERTFDFRIELTEPPKEFQVEQPNPIQLNATKGELTVAITSLDDLSFKMLSIGRDRWTMPDDGVCVFDRRVERVQFGLTSGTRELYEQMSPAYFKTVNYLLIVPGGQVHVAAFAGSRERDDIGKDFSVTDAEAILPSIRVVPND